MEPTITAIKTLSSEYNKYFWKRCNVAWPFQSKQNNIQTTLTAAVSSVRGSGIKITACIGRVIQDERSVFFKVMVLAIVRKSSYKHVSNFEWLLRHRCLNLQVNLHEIFVCGFGCRARFTNERWIHEMNCSLVLWMLLRV